MRDVWMPRTALGAALLLTLCRCNHPGCDGQAYKPEPEAPVITKLAIAGSYPDDPWTLVLGIEFTNGSATLSQGSALFYLGGDPTPARRPLSESFAQGSLPAGAPSGRLGVLFPFNGGTVQDGDRLRLGVQLEDGDKPDPDGRRSNCYNLDFSFAVAPTTTSMLQQLQRLAQRAARSLRVEHG